jgi:ABC-type branched-subunit amino acid transport system substrate-binding protein
VTRCRIVASHQLLQAQDANIKIGLPVPLTGPYGTEAQDQVRAGQLAVAQFNDAGGRMSALGSKVDVTLFHCDVRFVHPVYDQKTRHVGRIK